MFAPDAFRLSAAQAALIAKAREFGRRALAPRAAKYDREASFPIENFRDMHREGFLGICIPEEYGGSGLGIFEAGLMMRSKEYTASADAVTSPFEKVTSWRSLKV